MRASMCHHLPVRLSAEEKSAVKQLSGLLIPVYAAVVLAVIAVVAAGSGPQQNELIAARSVPTLQR
jgi:hypothetical protein